MRRLKLPPGVDEDTREIWKLMQESKKEKHIMFKNFIKFKMILNAFFEYISGFYTVDETVRANSSVKAVISGDNYNFLNAQVFPACVYYKNGDVWGNSSADYENVINNSRPAYIEHFALNIENVYEYDDSDDENNDDYNDYYDNGGMLPNYGEDLDWWQGFNDGDAFDIDDVEEPVRDLDGTPDYGSDILSDEKNEPPCSHKEVVFIR